MEIKKINVIAAGLMVAIAAGGLSYDASAQTSGSSNPRCQFVNPVDSATHYLQYPMPANYSANISERLSVPQGQTPTSLPLTDFKLEWAVVTDRANQPYRYDFVPESSGYKAELSSDASGSDSVSPIRGQAVSLAGNLITKIKNDPIKYTLTVKKDGNFVASCSVSVKHNVTWLEDYKAPEGVPGSGNPLFPYTAQALIGKNYVKAPHPASSNQLTFVGRYYDSKSTHGAPQSNVLGFYWGGLMNFADIEESSNNLYVNMGSSLSAYNKERLVTRLRGGEQVAFFRGTFFNNPSSGYQHALLPWDDNFNPMDPKNGIKVPFLDSRFTIGGLESDDRGYFYLSTNSNVGIVIAKDEGSSLKPVSQVLAEWDMPKPGEAYKTYGRISAQGKTRLVQGEGGWERLQLVKANGSYYLFANDHGMIGGNDSRFYRPFVVVYDVTSPMNPWAIKTKDTVRANDTILQAGTVVAAYSKDGPIRIYDAADYVFEKAAKKEFAAPSGGYHSLAVDENGGRFFALSYGAGGIVNLSVFSPGADKSPVSYTENKYPVSSQLSKEFSPLTPSHPAFSAGNMDYANGYLVATGKRSILLWKFNNGIPELLIPGISPAYIDSVGNIENATLHTIGGKNYLILSTFYVADVYEISGGTPLVIEPPTVPGPGTPPPPVITPPTQPLSCDERFSSLCQQIKELKEKICILVPTASICQN